MSTRLTPGVVAGLPGRRLRQHATAALLLLGVVPALAHAQGRAATDSLRTLDRLWAQTYAQHDTVAAKSLFSDSIVITTGSGRVKDKQGELADVRADPDLRVHYFRTRDVEARVRGGTGIVTGLAEWEYTYRGKVEGVRRRYTAVYSRGGSLGWEMVALHLGPAPDPPRTP